MILTEEAASGPGGDTYAPAAWRAALEAAITGLPVSADHVLVLGNIPVTRGNGPDCLSLHPTDVQQCSGHPLAYISALNDAERGAADATGARYIDTVPWFCSTTCTDVIGRYQPYWDPYHITAAYSAALGRVLADAVDLPGIGAPGRG